MTRAAFFVPVCEVVGSFHSDSSARPLRIRSGGLVLVADDSESDRFFLLRTFKSSGIKNAIHFVNTGAEVIHYLNGEGKYVDRNLFPFPTVIFLDLHMPPPNGFEVLRWKQNRDALPRILWVAMSNINTVRTIMDAYSAGANTFLAKPLDAADVRNLIQAFEEFWSKG